jgi:hypothetical protein
MNLQMIAFASLALLGFVAFGYFYWQAHYCFKFSLTTFLLLAGVSLFAGGYCFYKAVQCSLDFSEPSDEGCVQVSHARNTGLKLQGGLGSPALLSVLPEQKHVEVIQLPREGYYQ